MKDKILRFLLLCNIIILFLQLLFEEECKLVTNVFFDIEKRTLRLHEPNFLTFEHLFMHILLC